MEPRIQKKIRVLRKHFSKIKGTREGRIRNRYKNSKVVAKYQLQINRTSATEEKIKENTCRYSIPED